MHGKASLPDQRPDKKAPNHYADYPSLGKEISANAHHSANKKATELSQTLRTTEATTYYEVNC